MEISLSGALPRGDGNGLGVKRNNSTAYWRPTVRAVATLAFATAFRWDLIQEDFRLYVGAQATLHDEPLSQSRRG